MIQALLLLVSTACGMDVGGLASVNGRSITPSDITTTGSVGVGTTTPVGVLGVMVDNVVPLYIHQYSGSDAAGGANNPVINFRFARGTRTVPLRAQTSDIIGGMTAHAMQTNGAFSGSNKARIDFKAAEAWTSVANGSNISFLTTSSGSTTGAEKFRMTHDSSLRVGANEIASSALGMLVVGSSAAATLGLNIRDSSQVSLLTVGDILVTSTMSVHKGMITGPSQPFVSMKIASTQPIPAGVNTGLYFPTEDVDTQNMHNVTGTSSGTVTIPVGGAGFYAVNCVFRANAASGGGYIQVYPTLNGSTYRTCHGIGEASGSLATTVSCLTYMSLAASDAVRCHVQVNTATDAYGSATNTSYMEVIKLW